MVEYFYCLYYNLIMKYLKYFWYIIQHKYYVFAECWKKGLYLHAFTHDLSKFLPDEFFPYANWVYGKMHYLEKDISMSNFFNKNKYNIEKFYPEVKIPILKKKDKFDKACKKHINRNKHHWDYWWICRVGLVRGDMSIKYMKQMICDWEAMGRKFGDTAKDYYIKNKDNIKLCNKSKKYLEEQIKYKV